MHRKLSGLSKAEEW